MSISLAHLIFQEKVINIIVLELRATGLGQSSMSHLTKLLFGLTSEPLAIELCLCSESFAGNHSWLGSRAQLVKSACCSFGL